MDVSILCIHVYLRNKVGSTGSEIKSVLFDWHSLSATNVFVKLGVCETMCVCASVCVCLCVCVCAHVGVTERGCAAVMHT